jgi:uncharacterized repeat protein (TIGR03803 family)
LYGTTFNGGGLNWGAVFELTPSTGKWIEKILHSFSDNNIDGWGPAASLVIDSAGDLYGTTAYGGANTNDCAGTSCGTIFRLKRGKNGQWTEKVLHSFNNNGKDGFRPWSGLTIDASGNLYGVTAAGGTHPCSYGGGCGTVFELSSGTNDRWTETVLHSFNGNDGANPISNVILDAAGRLYGTTYYGGEVGCDPPYGCGTVFELTPGEKGKWTERVLRSFYKVRFPIGGVIFDAAGNLYGTSAIGGRYKNGGGCGTVGCGGGIFELSPGANGRWTATSLHSFGKNGDGVEPTGSLALDAHGNLFGATVFGGDTGCNPPYGCGTVFEITP